MPWCPVCKNEYKEGYTHCSECDIDLVDSLDEGPVAIFFGEEEMVQHLSEFLSANQIEGTFIHYDEDDKTYELYVPRDSEKQAKQQANVFVREIVRKEQAQQMGVSEEELDRMEEEGFDSESVDENGEDVVKKAASRQEPAFAATYEDKGAKAEEYKSSAYALFIVGIVGLVALVLLIMDILPFHLYGTSKILISVVMGALFIVFIGMAVSSMRVHKKYLVIAEEETALIEKINTYLKENLSIDNMNALINKNSMPDDSQSEDTDDAQLYFKATSIIRESLNAEFSGTEESLIEKLTDDWYTTLFDENTESESKSEDDEDSEE